MSRATVSVQASPWIACSREQAPEGVVVETCIIDHQSTEPRNVQSLKRRGRLWWFPGGEMYVYYTPTHWRLL